MSAPGPVSGEDADRAARQHIGDRALIAFGILVLLYFAGELLRAVL